MALFADDAIEELLRIYGEDELIRVQALIGSRTLREALRLIVEPQIGQATLFIPHYWAEFYHDGRAGFEAQAGRVLVFFADPDDDPRLEAGYPVRAADIRRLTREEFNDGLAENEARASDGRAPFMFVLRSVGPAGPHPFFDQLALGAAERMEQLAEFVIDSYVQDNVDDEGPQRSTARVRL